MKQKAHEEGFTDYEIKDMLRTHLKGSLSVGQIKWYLFEKDKYSLKKRLTGTSQVEGNKVLEQDTKGIELKSCTKAQDVAKIPNSSNTDVMETTTVNLDRGKEEQGTERVRDLKATIESQTRYIDMLEDKIQEKLEIQRAQSQLRIKVPVSQLFCDILMIRNSGATNTYIIIDNDRYIKLEWIGKA